MDIPVDEAFPEGFSLAGRSSLAVAIPLFAFILGSAVLLSLLDHTHAPSDTLPILLRIKQIKTLPADEQQEEKDWIRQHWQPLVGLLGAAAFVFVWVMAGQIGCLASRAQGDTSAALSLYFRRANALFLPYLLGNFLILSCTIVYMGFVLVTVVLLTTLSKGLALLILIPAFILIFWGAIKVALWGPSLALDGEGVLEAFGRAVALTETAEGWWKVFVLTIAFPLAWKLALHIIRTPLAAISPADLMFVSGCGSSAAFFLRNAILIAYASRSRLSAA